MTLAQIIELMLTAIMAVFLAYIAYQQMAINRKKLALELYNKRFKVYSDTLCFYQELVEGDVSKEVHRAFIGSKAASKFLFSQDPSIFELLDTMHSESFKSIGFKRHGKEWEGTPDYFETAKVSQETIFWLGKQITLLKNKMAPYLNQ